MSRATAPSSCLAGPGEPLEMHLVDVMEEARRDPAFAPIASKLARAFRVSPELAMDALEFTALAHDVGKADAAYKNAVEYFPLHEARSADFAYYVLAKAGLMQSNSIAVPGLDNAVVIAVALHHYSHKTPRAGAVAGGFRARCSAHVEAFRRWAPRTTEGAALRSVATSTLVVEQQGVYATISHYDTVSRINGYPKLRAATSAILGLLNKADRTVALRNRLKRF